MALKCHILCHVCVTWVVTGFGQRNYSEVIRRNFFYEEVSRGVSWARHVVRTVISFVLKINGKVVPVLN
jgi:hypothetical protein